MYQKSSGLSKFVIIFADLISVILSLFIAGYIRKGARLLRMSNKYPFSYLVFVFVLAFLITCIFIKGYGSFFTRGYLKELWHVIKMNVSIVIFVIMYLFFMKMSAGYSRMVIAIFAVIDVVVMFFVHQLLKRLLPYMYSMIIHKKHALIVGNSDFVGYVLNEIESSRNYSIEPIGVVISDVYEQEEFNGIKVVTDIEHLKDYCLTMAVDEIIVGTDKDSKHELMPMLDELSCAGMAIKYQLHIPTFVGAPYQMMERMGTNWFAVYANRVASTGKLLIKRGFDMVAGFVGCLVTLLLLIIFGPIIKIQSPGPIFFSQQRVGRNGRIFKIYKFRTMYKDAEERKKELMKQNEMDGLMFKMENDPRITPIGAFLRKTSIDEFPQFLNVFMGDMSLVGTRPPTLDEFNQYNLNQKSRLSFRPGITGLWQVSGRNDITDFDEIVALDMDYIRNWSCFLDAKIILKTIPAMLSGK